MSGRSFIWTTLFLGKPPEVTLNVFNVYYFASNCRHHALLESVEEGNNSTKKYAEARVDLGTACIRKGHATGRADRFVTYVCIALTRLDNILRFCGCKKSSCKQVRVVNTPLHPTFI